MPELSPKTKQYHKQPVRSLMVQQPMITILGMQQHLAHDGLPLDRHYIASLVRAIQTERIKRADTWTLNAALASLQDAIIIRDLFFTNLEIVSPYIKEDERLSLRSMFASVTTKSDYDAIQSRLARIATAHQVRLRPEKVE